MSGCSEFALTRRERTLVSLPDAIAVDPSDQTSLLTGRPVFGGSGDDESGVQNYLEDEEGDFMRV